MRVLVASTAGSGHFGPLLPFARGLVAAGHEVAVAAPESFADTVTGSGLDHRPFADVPVEVMGAAFAQLHDLPPDEADLVVVRDIFGRLDAQAALPGIRDTIEDWRPDLVLRDPAELGSLAAAEALGVPHVTIAIAMTQALDTLETWLTEPLAELDSLARLPAGRCAAAVTAAPVLTCVPAPLDSAVGLPARPVHRFRVEEVRSTARLPADWGDQEAPLVYVSFGSVAGGLGAFTDVYLAAVEALSQVPYRVLLTTGSGFEPDQLGSTPDHVHVERWWPQADLMPVTAALVGHGGFGTTMTGVLHGVPQVVLPLFSYDQRVNATQLAAVGAGVHLEGGIADLARLPVVLADLLSSAAARESAAALAVAAAGLPPVAEAVALLEDMV